jgi:hypothetical protein
MAYKIETKVLDIDAEVIKSKLVTLEVKGERILIQETYGLDWYNMKF